MCDRLRARSLVSKVVGRIASMCLHAAMQRWCAMTADVRTQRLRLSRAVARMQRIAVYSALSRWQDHTAEMARGRDHLTKAVTRMLNLRKSSAWRSWRVHVEERVRQRGVGKRRRRWDERSSESSRGCGGQSGARGTWLWCQTQHFLFIFTVSF